MTVMSEGIVTLIAPPALDPTPPDLAALLASLHFIPRVILPPNFSFLVSQFALRKVQFPGEGQSEASVSTRPKGKYQGNGRKANRSLAKASLRPVQ